VPLALVSDIHGNDRAFAAVCLGDAVQGGHEPRQVLDRLADAGRLDQLRSFRPTVELGSLLAFHGSPRSYDDVLLPETEDDSAWRVAGFEVLAGGHTHRQWTRAIGGALYVNPGAVMSEPAEFAVLTDRSVEFFRCAY